MPLFSTIPTLILGGVAEPNIAGNKTGNNNPFAFFLYRSTFIDSFPFQKTDSKPIFVTISSCQPVLGSPMRTTRYPWRELLPEPDIS